MKRMANGPGIFVTKFKAIHHILFCSMAVPGARQLAQPEMLLKEGAILLILET